MLQFIKNVLKLFLPPPIKLFHREIERLVLLIRNLETKTKSHYDELSKTTSLMKSLQNEVFEKQQLLTSIDKQLADLIEKQKRFDNVDKQLVEVIVKGDSIFKLNQNIENSTKQSKRAADEAVWAEIFNNTIVNSAWLNDRTFSPGRWAIGYPPLYVIYRILNEVRPKRILELGLGQSTRLIGQYAAAHKDVEHFVVEHDSEWIEFFSKDFKLATNTNIVQLDREMIPYKDAEEVRVFKGFAEAFKDKQFDFIFIDAPLGGDMKQFARIDILKMLPTCLDKSFIVALDDCERSGEAATLKEMHNVFNDNKIQFSSGIYQGNKDFAVLCSDDLKFVCTM